MNVTTNYWMTDWLKSFSRTLHLNIINVRINRLIQWRRSWQQRIITAPQCLCSFSCPPPPLTFYFFHQNSNHHLQNCPYLFSLYHHDDVILLFYLSFNQLISSYCFSPSGHYALSSTFCLSHTSLLSLLSSHICRFGLIFIGTNYYCTHLERQEKGQVYP